MDITCAACAYGALMLFNRVPDCKFVYQPVNIYHNVTHPAADLSLMNIMNHKSQLYRLSQARGTVMWQTQQQPFFFPEYVFVHACQVVESGNCC